MKKHAGTVVYAALMIALFGLILMGAAYIVSGMVFGSSYADAPDVVKSAVTATSQTSNALLCVGGLMLFLGLFMRSGGD